MDFRLKQLVVYIEHWISWRNLEFKIKLSAYLVLKFDSKKFDVIIIIFLLKKLLMLFSPLFSIQGIVSHILSDLIPWFSVPSRALVI